MKRIVLVLIGTLLLSSSFLTAQDSTAVDEDSFGEGGINIRLGMLIGVTSERIRMQGAETDVEGFRLQETGFFQTDLGVILGLEIELLLGDKFGVRLQPTISLLEVTYYLIDPIGTTSPFNVGRSSLAAPLHMRFFPWGREKGLYGFMGGRWRIETGRTIASQPFDLEKSNWAADAGLGYTINMARGSMALEATYSQGLKDQFPNSVSLGSGLPDRIYHDRLLFAIVFR